MKKQLIFAYVDVVGEQPYRQEIGVYQTTVTVQNGISVPAKTVTLTPSLEGLFFLDGDDPDLERKLAAIDLKKKSSRGLFDRLVGPFDTIVEARAAQFDHRPKTPVEAAAIATDRANRADAILADPEALRRRIAELEHAPAPDGEGGKEPGDDDDE